MPLPAFALALVVALAGPGISSAAQFPEREMDLVVNFGPGGTTDVAARAVANGMERLLRKPISVINMPGAMGTAAPSFLSKQKPDGYTMGVVTYSSVVIQPQLNRVDYTAGSFDYIAAIGRYRYGMAVRADSPLNTVSDLVKAARVGHGVTFGVPSAPNNLAMLVLAQVTGVKLSEVAYNSGPETTAALLAGHVDVTVQNPADLLPLIQAGRLRLLASAGPKRWPELPEVPTLMEQGFDIAIDSWMGFALPYGAPESVRLTLQDAAIRSVNNADVRAKLVAIGIEPMPLPGGRLEELLRLGRVETRRAMEAASIQRR